MLFSGRLCFFSCKFFTWFSQTTTLWKCFKLNILNIILFPETRQFLWSQPGGLCAERDADMNDPSLDIYEKWNWCFGWLIGTVRHKPCAIIPDEPWCLSRNVWGGSGKKADTSERIWNCWPQDSGGYKMPAEWVNMVQFTQTKPT